MPLLWYVCAPYRAQTLYGILHLVCLACVWLTDWLTHKQNPQKRSLQMPLKLRLQKCNKPLLCSAVHIRFTCKWNEIHNVHNRYMGKWFTYTHCNCVQYKMNTFGGITHNNCDLHIFCCCCCSFSLASSSVYSLIWLFPMNEGHKKEELVCILLSVRESLTWKILLIYICFHLRSLFACWSFIRKCSLLFFLCFSYLFFIFFVFIFFLLIFNVFVVVLCRNHLLLFNFVVLCNERFFLRLLSIQALQFFSLLL